jgi:Protein of unknown function (DUF2470)
MSTTSTTAPQEDVKKGISDGMSKRICDHMNEDHAVSVYAMAKRKGPKSEPGFKMSGATIRKVTMDGATLNVQVCRGDACQQHEAIYPFVPPLTEPNQIRSRMVAIHHQVCNPISCYDHTLFPAVVIFFIVSSYYAAGFDGPDSDPTLRKALHDCFYLMLFGHAGMAIYGTYLSYSVLKLKRLGIMRWTMAIFLSGWLGMKELLELVSVNEKSKEAKLDKMS